MIFRCQHLCITILFQLWFSFVILFAFQKLQQVCVCSKTQPASSFHLAIAFHILAAPWQADALRRSSEANHSRFMLEVRFFFFHLSCLQCRNWFLWLSHDGYVLNIGVNSVLKKPLICCLESLHHSLIAFEHQLDKISRFLHSFRLLPHFARTSAIVNNFFVQCTYINVLNK